MSNDKQSSIQQLVNSLIKLGYLHSNGFGQSLKVTEVINQAKAMHKNEIVKAFIYGDASDCLDEDDSIPYAEEYYNNTFQ